MLTGQSWKLFSWGLLFPGNSRFVSNWQKKVTVTPVSSPISHKHRSVTKEQPHFLESHVNTILVHARCATAIATHLFLALTSLTQHKCCKSLPCCWVIGKYVFFSELHCMVKRGPSPGMAFRDFLFGVNVNQVDIRTYILCAFLSSPGSTLRVIWSAHGGMRI
jgi:hypothetical protein